MAGRGDGRRREKLEAAICGFKFGMKRSTRVKRGIKTRRLAAGWNEGYLLEALTGQL